MSRTIQTVTKWLPGEITQFEANYENCQQLKMDSFYLNLRISTILNNVKKKSNTKIYHNCIQNELNIQELEDISTTMEVLVGKFNNLFPKLAQDPHHPHLIHEKNKMWKDLLWKIKLKICYLTQELINEIAHLFINFGEHLLVLTLKIATCFNNLLAMDTRYGIVKNLSICNNTCPYLFFPLRKMSVTRFLQILAMNRAELCCHKLIDCLLDTYQQQCENNDDDDSSDNSSMEIYKALTKHLSPTPKDNQIIDHPQSENELIEQIGIFPTIDELIAYEEKNVIDLLEVILKISPVMLGNDGVKKSKITGDKIISPKAQEKVLDYYEQILWVEIGNYLEHIILWWAASPLSARPPHSSQHLREWINQFIPTANVPSVILSTLNSLSDALGVHVTLTNWDRLFRSALVASKSPNLNEDTGKLFGRVLQDLVQLSNQCEITADWIVGAPLNDLPIVEQIPVLHRLDHSIHTMRLWAVNETKKIANVWNVDAFFMVTHCDIVNCMAQLNNLRLADHSIEIEKGGMEVHVQVCALMRAKLASEVTVNFEKLKATPNECVQGLAKICRTICLANLQMIFPPAAYWRKALNPQLATTPSEYVAKYLNRILSPIIEATDDPLITNMILQIICECWLDHIYMNKIKFTQYGACQLLCDFASIESWLVECAKLSQTMRKKMLKNEILRRCEGVGRLLLRCPGEQIKMMDKQQNGGVKQGKEEEESEENPSELMPAEMYVPNQEQWLELRAIKKRQKYLLFNTSLCCGKF